MPNIQTIVIACISFQFFYRNTAMFYKPPCVTFIWERCYFIAHKLSNNLAVAVLVECIVTVFISVRISLPSPEVIVSVFCAVDVRLEWHFDFRLSLANLNRFLSCSYQLAPFRLNAEEYRLVAHLLTSFSFPCASASCSGFS